MAEQYTCPRRAEGGQRPGGPDPDSWRDGRAMGGQDPVGLCCSYCGSLHPGRFLELVREGWIVGPTDKAYKAYLDKPAGGTVAKVYFQHLSEQQRREFVALLNSKRLRISYPGYLYVLPFFARPMGGQPKPS